MHPKSLQLTTVFYEKLVMTKRIDLHTHSTASDGVLSPAEVVRLAHQEGVGTIALTDHDTVDGLEEARQEAERLGMRFVPGVELSVTWGKKTIHIVSLAPKELGPYRCYAKRIWQQRDARARKMGAKFEALGIYNMYESALELAGNPLNLSRRHFAMALHQRGTVGSEDEAFARYLRDDGPAFVKTEWSSLSDAMRLIEETGGIAVLAHPGRYRFPEPYSIQDLLEDFRALGGEVIEVTTGSHCPSENESFIRVAVNMGFAASTGSDYHGHRPGRPGLGQQEQLPTYLTTVLDLIDKRNNQ